MSVVCATQSWFCAVWGWAWNVCMHAWYAARPHADGGVGSKAATPYIYRQQAAAACSDLNPVSTGPQQRPLVSCTRAVAAQSSPKYHHHFCFTNAAVWLGSLCCLALPLPQPLLAVDRMDRCSDCLRMCVPTPQPLVFATDAWLGAGREWAVPVMVYVCPCLPEASHGMRI